MRNLTQMTGRVLACFLVFDVIGVALTLLVDIVAAIDIVLETSTALYYVVWFVVGVFCAVSIYSPADDGDFTSPVAHRRGTGLVILTGLMAIALGFLSSLVWRGGEFAEPVAPDHRGITITYLITVTLTVAWARFVLFREPLAADAGAIAPSEDARYERATELAMRQASTSAHAAGPEVEEGTDSEPAGFLATLGFLFGVPVLLFLDASFFVLAPFDYFDQWTDPILTSALVGGVVWGAAAARWRNPRYGLFALHVPLLLGVIGYVFALLPAGILLAFDVPARVGEIVAYVGFWGGFLLGCWAVVFGLAAVFERPPPGWVARG